MHTGKCLLTCKRSSKGGMYSCFGRGEKVGSPLSQMSTGLKWNRYKDEDIKIFIKNTFELLSSVVAKPFHQTSVQNHSPKIHYSCFSNNETQKDENLFSTVLFKG